jgi:hypothetical protein
VDSMNPFMSPSSIVLKPNSQERVSRSLTRNNTYAICCQVLPPGSRVGQFRARLGSTRNERFRPLAPGIWEVFHIPLASVRIIVLETGEIQLSALRPLEFSGLTSRERSYLNQEITWPKKERDGVMGQPGQGCRQWIPLAEKGRHFDQKHLR